MAATDETYVTWDGGQYVVRGDFEPDAARTIANALARSGFQAEAADWRESAARVEAIRGGAS